MSLTSSLLSRVLQGGSCTREELIALSREPLEELCQAANAIREHFCGNVFDLCTIINGRSGKCSENCKYCAQSAHYSTAVEEYPLLSDEALLAGARYNDERGILRYSIVTSGKRLTDADVDRLCASYRHIAERCGISLCASHGLISKKHCEQLKAAGRLPLPQQPGNLPPQLPECLHHAHVRRQAANHQVGYGSRAGSVQRRHQWGVGKPWRTG